MNQPLSELAEDLVVSAWEAHRGSSEPAAIELVSDGGFPLKTVIFRLRGAGPGGVDVVAKRARIDKAAVERAVYEQVLPGSPVRALAYYGATEERGSKFCWLFLEEARGERYSTDEHRALGDEWLARLHGAAAGLSRPEKVPPSGPAESLADLRAARKGIARGLVDERLKSADEAALTAALALLDRLEAGWDGVAELCAGVPETLQHGAFVSKNLLVDPDGEPLPLSWEAAGWGPPAVDLVFVEPGRYLAHASETWPELTAEAIERAARAGRIFRRVSALRWATRDYPSDRAKRKLEDQQRKLEKDMRAAGLH